MGEQGHSKSKTSPRRRKALSAVALCYEPLKFTAPKLVAKGKGKVAEKIVQLAKDKGIPIYEDPDLVAALATLDWHEQIPEELYRAVAEVLAFAYRLNKELKAHGS